MNERFHFTITDVARFLGKSSVTLRTWERQGLVSWPRSGTDRRFSTGDVRNATHVATKLGRITRSRARLVEATMTLLELIERR